MTRVNTGPITQQTAISRIVDIGFHHRGVDAHTFPFDDPVLHRDCNYASMQIRNHIGSDDLPKPSQCLRIRHLLCADPGECPVHQIGPDFPLQHFIAPVANVFEDEKPQHHF